jgi:hypothetical protein
MPAVHIIEPAPDTRRTVDTHGTHLRRACIINSTTGRVAHKRGGATRVVVFLTASFHP